jgi:hypothetical protein
MICYVCYWYVQSDQKVSVHLMSTVHKKHKKDGRHRIHSEYGPCYTDHGLREHRRVNKCLETGGGHFEHLLSLSVL